MSARSRDTPPPVPGLLNLHGMDPGGSYLRVDLVIDSGAFRSVIPPRYVSGHKLVPLSDPEARAGQTASGQTLRPLGRTVVTCEFNRGAPKTLDFLVMEVTRPLGSVHQMVSQGSLSGFQVPSKK